MDQDGKTYHRPVLVEETVDLMSAVMPGVIVDATFGGGGHSRAFMQAFGEDVKVVALDRDPDALANVPDDDSIFMVEGNFAELRHLVGPVLDEAPAGILFDFGVSSRQLDHPERGFSYHHQGPLDMRMGPDAPYSADDIVNTWSVSDIARVIGRYGEESMARRIADAIVRARPIESTTHLSTVIAEVMPAARRRAGHPARRTFQALRIAVNSELDAVAAGIDQAIEMVRPGGRVVAISYHSLEDRIVKRRFAEGARGCICPPGLPVCGCGRTAELTVLTPKPIRPSEAEVETNRRARSAVLRAMEKMAA